MTISNTSRIAGPFLGNGATTDFPFGFKVFSTADMLVVLTVVSTGTSVEQVLNLNYYVVLNADQNANPGGTIKMLTAPASGTSLVVTSDMDVTQTLDLTNSGGFYPAVINAALDRVVILIQQLYGALARTVRFPLSDGSTISELPAAGARAGKLLGFDANGNFTAVVPVDGSASSVLSSLSASVGAALVGYKNSPGLTVERQLDLLTSRAIDVREPRFAGGAKFDGIADDTAAIQAALDLAGIGGIVILPPGTGKVTATLKMKSNCLLLGSGRNSTRIQRYGNYGHTLAIGTTSIPARAASVKEIWFIHGDAWSPTDTTLNNLITGDSAHIYVEGGQYIDISYCWFDRMPFGIVYNQSTWCRLANNRFTGVWDLTRPALQEGIANVAMKNGNVSSVFENNEFLGAKLTRSTTLTDGTGHSLVVPTFVDLVGPQYGLLIQGAEDFTCTQNFFGAHSRNSILFNNQAGSFGTIDVRVTENMFDETRYGNIVFNPGAANLYSLAVTIAGNIFNGESDSQSAIIVNKNSFSNDPSVYNLGIHNNRMFAYYASMIVISGAKGFVVSGNTITNYNCLGVSPDDVSFVAGIFVASGSNSGEIYGNTIGGGGNIFTADAGSNFCYMGVYIDSTVDNVVSKDNYYTGIRNGSTFRSGPSGDENQAFRTVAGNYAMRPNDSVYIGRKATSAATAITLPPLPMTGREVVVKDGNGDATAFNTIIGTADGSLIDGAANITINTNYGFKRLRFNGVDWNVIG